MNVLISMALLQEASGNWPAACATFMAAQRHDPENKKIQAKILSLKKQAGTTPRGEPGESQPFSMAPEADILSPKMRASGVTSKHYRLEGSIVAES